MTVAGSNNTPAVLMPGDFGYKNALNSFLNKQAAVSPGASLPTVALSSFGAYADLNYMYGTSGSNGVPEWLFGRLVEVRAECCKGDAELPASAAFCRSRHANLRSGLSAHYTVLVARCTDFPQPPYRYPQPDRTGQVQNMGVFTCASACVYDTWSSHYESDGIDNDGDGSIDEGTDGLDNPCADEQLPGQSGVGSNIAANKLIQVYGVDDPTEQEAPPPYPYPLRGIQIKIRVFEPDSKQVREITLTHEFLQE